MLPPILKTLSLSTDDGGHPKILLAHLERPGNLFSFNFQQSTGSVFNEEEPEMGSTPQKWSGAPAPGLK